MQLRYLLLVLICAYSPLLAMQQDPAINTLLMQYPAPSVKNGFLAGVFGDTTDQELVHKNALQEAEQQNDYPKKYVLNFVFEGYFKVPQLFWSSARSRQRIIEGKQALRSAILMGREDLVALLLAHNVSAHDFAYSTGPETRSQCMARPLHTLIQVYPEDESKQPLYERIALRLLAHGAQLNELDRCCKRHAVVSPLWQAIVKGNSNLARFLVKHGADVDRPDSSGNTLLCVSILSGKPKAIEQLLELGADPSYALPFAYSRNKAWVTWLLNNGARIDKKNFNNKTILHKAIKKIKETSDVYNLLCQATFEPTRSELVERRKRLLAFLSVLRRFGVSRDARGEIIKHLPELVCSQGHYQLLVHKCVPLDQLLPRCLVKWCRNTYQLTKLGEQPKILQAMVPIFVTHRLNKIRELLESRWVKDLYIEHEPGFVNRYRQYRNNVSQSTCRALNPEEVVVRYTTPVEEHVKNALVHNLGRIDFELLTRRY